MFGLNLSLKRLAFAGALLGFALSAMPAGASNGSTGNGAPSGYHYELNIHGTKGTPDASTTSNGHDIFVPLNNAGALDSTIAKDCDDILLTQGTTFGVLNPDCWNGLNQSPEFQLPNPQTACQTGYYCTAYTVWARAQTKGSATMQTCYTDTTGVTYCATGAQVLTLSKKAGSGGFQDATQQLLFYCNATTGYLSPIFSPSNYTYFWDYDNQGLKLAQLRFYPATSDQISATTGCTNKVGP